MALKSNALITLKNLKTYLTITQDDYNLLLEKLINSVSDDLKGRLGFNIVYNSYSSEKISGQGQIRLFLPGRPIWDVSSLTEDSVSMVLDTDYVIEEVSGEKMFTYLRKIVSGLESDNDLVWNKGIKNIAISYTSGWWVSSDPDADDGATEMIEDIQMGVAMQVGLLRKRFNAEDWDVTSVAFPDGSMSKNIIELHPLYRDIVDKYRRIQI